jgi:hypothetical protein
MTVRQARVARFRSSRIAATAILGIVLIALGVAAYHYGIRTQIVRMTADIGIPGVTTSYSVKVKNWSPLPITFEGVQLASGYPADLLP